MSALMDVVTQIRAASEEVHLLALLTSLVLHAAREGGQELGVEAGLQAIHDRLDTLAADVMPHVLSGAEGLFHVTAGTADDDGREAAR